MIGMASLLVTAMMGVVGGLVLLVSPSLATVAVLRTVTKW
jgi:hypothetical protein